MSDTHHVIRCNNAVWWLLYYDELVDQPSYQLSYVENADQLFYNCAHVLTASDRQTLAAIERFYRARAVRPAVYLDPSSPPEAAGALASAGYVYEAAEDENWQTIALDPASLERAAAASARATPNGVVSVAAVDARDPGALATFVDVDARANELPPAMRDGLLNKLGTRTNPAVRNHLLVASIDGAPCSTGSVGIIGDLAFLAEGGTLPEYRRRGLYSLVLVERMRVAAAAGARRAYFTASAHAASNPAAARLGFTVAFKRQLFRLT